MGGATHVGHLWSSNGSLLATLTFSGESASGWQQAHFSTPVNIAAGSTYVISFSTGGGYFGITDNGITSAGYSNGPLHALPGGYWGGNGVYGPEGSFPNDNGQGMNFWVDVLFARRQRRPTCRWPIRRPAGARPPRWSSPRRRHPPRRPRPPRSTPTPPTPRPWRRRSRSESRRGRALPGRGGRRAAGPTSADRPDRLRRPVFCVRRPSGPSVPRRRGPTAVRGERSSSNFFGGVQERLRSFGTRVGQPPPAVLRRDSRGRLSHKLEVVLG